MLAGNWTGYIGGALLEIYGTKKSGFLKGWWRGGAVELV